jgi:hypothetical protein
MDIIAALTAGIKNRYITFSGWFGGGGTSSIAVFKDGVDLGGVVGGKSGGITSMASYSAGKFEIGRILCNGTNYYATNVGQAFQ